MTAPAYRFTDTGQLDPTARLEPGAPAGRIHRSSDFQVIVTPLLTFCPHDTDDDGTCALGEDRCIIRHLLADWTWLSIKRNDRGPIRGWRPLQAIKNSLHDGLFARREALELYPSTDRTVDTANQRHLWMMPAGQRFPFGFDSGRLVADDGEAQSVAAAFDIDPSVVAGARQRPFATDGLTADDL